MSEPLERVRAALLDGAGLVRAVASGRRRGEQPRWRRVEVRYVDLAAGRRLQVTAYDDTQAFTTNHDDPAVAVSELLAEPFGSWHVETTDRTLQVRVTKKGRTLVHDSARDGAVEPDRGHDRRKDRMLEATAPVLRELGLTDAEGRIKPSRQDKYRQVEQFLRALDTALTEARDAGHLREPTAAEPWRIVDLGCGNAYLTFAALAWLRDARGLPVRLTGVDVKEQAREHNSAVAERLGWQDAATFVTGSIGEVGLDPAPEIVLALHACDTATDDALARAVGWEAVLALAAPCCHHDIAAQLRRGATPAPYAMLTRDGILRERLADSLTDALRASLMRLSGYRVEVVEFVPSRHTPRNTLLRAVRTGGLAAGVQEEYDDLVATWQLRPKLAALLEKG